MPNGLALENNHWFGPEEIAGLTTAFEAALAKLGLVDRSDPTTLTLGKAPGPRLDRPQGLSLCSVDRESGGIAIHGNATIICRFGSSEEPRFYNHSRSLSGPHESRGVCDSRAGWMDPQHPRTNSPRFGGAFFLCAVDATP
jgi:hypothetical protein